MTRSENALEAAKAGATVASEAYQTSVSVNTKSSKMDYVTDADTRSQEQVIERIREEYPDGTIVGEEEDELKSIPESGDAWVIDPIDGTTNFVHEIPLWTSTVAVVQGGETTTAVTVAPALNDIFRADASDVMWNDQSISVSEKTDIETFCVAPVLRYGPERDNEFGTLMSELIDHFGDLRRFGCAQLTLAMVAAGSMDAAVSAQPQPNPWDTVAGVYMVERAGGTVTDIHGEQWRPGCEGIIATNGEVHDTVLEIVQSTVQ